MGYNYGTSFNKIGVFKNEETNESVLVDEQDVSSYSNANPACASKRKLAQHNLSE